MQAERELLQTKIFPELEEELRTRFYLLEPVDLRMGVGTASLASEAERDLRVLRVCLDEIHRSRPFFIGILGERYGWIPPPEHALGALREWVLVRPTHLVKYESIANTGWNEQDGIRAVAQGTAGAVARGGGSGTRERAA
ncbi:MAG: DUF4062 domain-containing protein, partial [Acidobacteria bacterium]|nr:DUF4062 domain-containing protein [Acidobacteriota bacterium]